MRASHPKRSARIGPIAWAVGFVGTVLALAGCDQARPPLAPPDTAPSPSTELAALATSASSEPCDSACVLVNGILPLRLTVTSADSADGAVALAAVRLSVSPGDSLMLDATMSPAAANAVGEAVALRVTANGARTEVPLSRLTSATVLHFAASGTVTVQYELTRRGQHRPNGTFRLVQRLSGRSRVEEATRPWLDVAQGRFASLIAFSCALDAEVDLTACSGLVYEFTPPVSFGGVFGGFQFEPGSGVMGPIDLSFSAPVEAVEVTVHDPSFAGNVVTAHDVSGAVVEAYSYPFAPPGTLTEPTHVFTGEIARLTFVPPSNEYVSYSMRLVPAVAAGTLGLSCPTAVTRGETATCTMTASTPVPFRVDSVVAVAVVNTDTVRNQLLAAPHSAPAGGSVPIGGIMVTATALRAYGAVTNDQGTGFQVRVTPERRVAVSPRPWNFAQRPGLSAQPDPLNTAPVEVRRVVARPLATDVVPGSGSAAATIVGYPTIDSGDVTYITAGPNARIAYLPVIPALPQGQWWRNPDVEPGGAWRADQNGGTDPAFGTARCDSTQVPVFIREVERHEGVGRAPNSHQGIYDQGDALLGSTVEEVVSFGASAILAADRVRARAVGQYRGKREQLTGARHAALQNVDAVRWYVPSPTGIFPCRWDFTSRDP